MQYYNNNSGGRLANAPVTKNLLIINLIVFIATQLSPDFMMRNFALFYPTSHYFHWWQLVTHMFMHGGFAHIFFNMFSLFMFGTLVERTIGSKKFLYLYFISGLGAVALHFGVMWAEIGILNHQISLGSASALQTYAQLKSTPVVGASGAIYGLLISYALLYPDNRLTLIFPPITMKAKTWVIIFAVTELFSGISGWADGVAHFAHLGGMLFAWVLIRYWRKKGVLFMDYRG